MALPLEDGTLRTAVGAVGVFTALVVFTGYTLQSLAPVILLSVVMLTYNAADEAYDLPDGTNGIAYGLGLIGVGGFVALRYATRFGGVILLASGSFLTVRPRFDTAPPERHTGSSPGRRPKRRSECEF